jgi:hypothetical protein
MLITLNGTLYHYCEIDAGTVSSLLSAPSIERFYNARIKGHLTAGFIEGLNIESSVEGPSPCRAGSRFDCEPGSAAGSACADKNTARSLQIVKGIELCDEICPASAAVLEAQPLQRE